MDLIIKILVLNVRGMAILFSKKLLQLIYPLGLIVDRFCVLKLEG